MEGKNRCGWLRLRGRTKLNATLVHEGDGERSEYKVKWATAKVDVLRVKDRASAREDVWKFARSLSVDRTKSRCWTDRLIISRR